MKVVTYKRLSKEDRTRNQHGFDSQELDIQDYLKDVPNHEIVGEFQEFVSGAADHKPELEKAMELCRELGATLVVAKLCRLSRRVFQICMYMESSVEFKVSTLPSANNFQLHLYAALAEEERQTIRKRVKRGLEAAKAKGVKLGAASEKYQTTYQRNKEAGLHKQSKVRTQQNPELINRVKQMHSDSNGSMTQTEMAARLNAEGYKTSRGNKVVQGTVSAIIKKYC